MDQNITQLLEEVTRKTQSELILFFIIIIVGMVLVLIPFYTIMTKNNRAKEAALAANETAKEAAERERLDMYIKREQQLIQVVSTNTEALVSLKTTQEITLNNLKTAVESGNKNVDKSLDRLHTRLDEVLKQEAALINGHERLSVLVERSILNQQTIKDITSNILLIVDSMPHDSNFSMHGGLHYAANSEPKISKED